jgi:hypothetical protein
VSRAPSTFSRHHCRSGPISPVNVSDLRDVPVALRFGPSIARHWVAADVARGRKTRELDRARSQDTFASAGRDVVRGNSGWIWQGFHDLKLDCSPATKIRGKEIVMAKVIEFYVPKTFRNPFVRTAQPQPGKLIEFCSEATKSVPTLPASGVLGWLLAVTESDLAVGIE